MVSKNTLKEEAKTPSTNVMFIFKQWGKTADEDVYFVQTIEGFTKDYIFSDPDNPIACEIAIDGDHPLFEKILEVAVDGFKPIFKELGDGMRELIDIEILPPVVRELTPMDKIDALRLNMAQTNDSLLEIMDALLPSLIEANADKLTERQIDKVEHVLEERRRYVELIEEQRKLLT